MIEPTKIYKTGLVVVGAVTAAGLALGFSAHAKLTSLQIMTA